MKKIPTIFERDWEGDKSRVLDKPHPDCGWVFAGEGVATRKLDGTCCLIDMHGQVWKRRELREGESYPAEFKQADFDAQTGKRIGWVPIGAGPEDRWYREAVAPKGYIGTCELVGPKIQGNPEGYHRHEFVPHTVEALRLDPVPASRSFRDLEEFFAGHHIEGIVFHHPDGRMAKIKARDFGMKRRKQK